MAKLCGKICCTSCLVIALVFAVSLLVFLFSLHQDNFFYCYIFDHKKFYKANTISKIKNLYTGMKVNHEEKLFFDYVIIGAGTAGSVIANRLSEKSTLSILVIEAGKNMNGNLFKEIPGKLKMLIELLRLIVFYLKGLAPFTWSNTYGEFTWNYTTVPQNGALNRKFKWPGFLF